MEWDHVCSRYLHGSHVVTLALLALFHRTGTSVVGDMLSLPVSSLSWPRQFLWKVQLERSYRSYSMCGVDRSHDPCEDETRHQSEQAREEALNHINEHSILLVKTSR